MSSSTKLRVARFVFQLIISLFVLTFCMAQLLRDEDTAVYMTLISAIVMYWMPSPSVKTSHRRTTTRHAYDPSVEEEHIGFTPRPRRLPSPYHPLPPTPPTFVEEFHPEQEGHDGETPVLTRHMYYITTEEDNESTMV
jgi:hypothetical protein